MARILAIALAVSLVFNGFLLGRMIGPFGPFGAPDAVQDRQFSSDARHGEGRRGDRRRGVDRTVSHLLGDIDALPPEAREKLREGFAARRSAYYANRNEEAALRNEFSLALSREPLDRPAAEAAIAKLYESRADRELSMAKVLIDVFEQLPAEKRAQLIAESKDRRTRRLENWRERRDRRDRAMDD